MVKKRRRWLEWPISMNSYNISLHDYSTFGILPIMRNEQPNQIHFFPPLFIVHCYMIYTILPSSIFQFIPIPPPSTSFSLYNFSQIGYWISYKSLSLLPPKHLYGDEEYEFVYSLLQTELIIFDRKDNGRWNAQYWDYSFYFYEIIRLMTCYEYLHR